MKKKNYYLNVFKNSKVLITGSTGFKGSWLSFWLKKLGANVVGIGLKPEKNFILFNRLNLKKKITQYIFDISNYSKISKVIKKEKPDIIFHLAAQSIVTESFKYPIKTINSNVIGSLNLLESMRNNLFNNLIYITSDKCYLNNNLIKKLTEALKGTDNQAGTLILGAMLQKQLKSTGRATSDPSLITSENSKESALGFKVKELEGKNLDESAKLTKDAIVNSLMNDFGLKKDQFRIIDEKTNNGESLVKVQIIDPTISASLRNDAQNILKQYQDNAQTQTRTNTEVSVPRVNAENVAVPVAGTVNNNVSVVSFVKPDWWDGAMKSANEGTMSAVKNLEGAFSRLTDMLKQNLQK